MAISGYLSEFSLPEILQLLEQGDKTGCLSIQDISPQSSNEGQIFHIWVKQGRIVAAANRLDGHGLVSLIQQRGWFSARSAIRIIELCSANQPAGLCFKSQGLLGAEQLKLLFGQQVLQQMRTLFELEDGKFRFESTTALPPGEMTGLSATTKEVTLASLRALPNWTMLNDKLPESTSGLISAVSGKPQLKLNHLEWQIWKFSDGSASMREIAKSLQLPIEKIQQAAFRLMSVSLVEEVPLIVEAPVQSQDSGMQLMREEAQSNPLQSAVSQSFLNNLVSFLKGKT